MTINLGKDIEFDADNVIIENDGRFLELIQFLKKDCGAEFDRNRKYSWAGNYEITQDRKKYKYALNYYRSKKDDFEIVQEMDKIKCVFYARLEDIYGRFFKAENTFILKVDYCDIENNEGEISKRYRWKLDPKLTLSDMGMLQAILKEEIDKRLKYI